MAYEMRDNSGSSFKNDRKREGKKDADYTGSIMVSGHEFWIDTWVKNNPREEGYDPSKKTFLSHSLRLKEGRQSQGQQSAPPPRRTAPAPPPPKKTYADPDLDPPEDYIPF